MTYRTWCTQKARGGTRAVARVVLAAEGAGLGARLQPRLPQTHGAVAAIADGNVNVKAFFSGHIHRLDRIEAKGQTFICAGSVSSDQWRGPDVDTQEGFAIADCRADGTFSYRYDDYGWEAQRS
jgi:hypothetical protein